VLDAVGDADPIEDVRAEEPAAGTVAVLGRVADAPFGHWKTQTFIAGPRCAGLIAPWVLDGAMTREAYDTYVLTQLARAPGQGR